MFGTVLESDGKNYHEIEKKINERRKLINMLNLVL